MIDYFTHRRILFESVKLPYYDGHIWIVEFRENDGKQIVCNKSRFQDETQAVKAYRAYRKEWFTCCDCKYSRLTSNEHIILVDCFHPELKDWHGHNIPVSEEHWTRRISNPMYMPNRNCPEFGNRSHILTVDMDIVQKVLRESEPGLYKIYTS